MDAFSFKSNKQGAMGTISDFLFKLGHDCRRLAAATSDALMARRLRGLAVEYEVLAIANERGLLPGGLGRAECEELNLAPTKLLMN